MANKIEKQFLDTENKGPVRLNKYLSEAGVCSRREADKLIAAGQVTVDGVRAETGMKVEPWQVVRIGKKQVSRQEEMIVLAVNKPRGIVCTEERRERDSIVRFLNYPVRITYVGRLDKDTEGLLLITDDGQLAHQLLSPKKHVDKTYFAVTEGKVVPEDIEKIRVGVDIGDQELTLPGKLEILKSWEENPEQGVASGKDCEGKNVKGDSETMTAKANNEEYKADVEKSSWRSEILLTIQEGRFHQVKRMAQAVGRNVTYLKRISMGNLVLDPNLKKGEYRSLTEKELTSLKKK